MYRGMAKQHHKMLRKENNEPWTLLGTEIMLKTLFLAHSKRRLTGYRNGYVSSRTKYSESERKIHYEYFST